MIQQLALILFYRILGTLSNVKLFMRRTKLHFGKPNLFEGQLCGLTSKLTQS